jgi:hypothetical protein
MKRALASLWLIAGTAATIAVLWAASWPLGVPGEWEWPRLPVDAESILNVFLALCGAAAYVLVVAVGSVRLQHVKVTRAETAAWLVVLWGAAFGWLWCVQETAPTAGTLGKAPFVLFYPGASGYFTHARFEEPDMHRFLADYEALLHRGGQDDVLHIGTHPPGLFCVFYGLIAVVDGEPRLAQWLTDQQPDSVRGALAIIATNTALTSEPLQPRDGAVLWLAVLLAQSMAALTVIPLYGLLRWTLSRPAAFCAAAFWPAVPAVAMFLPKSDAAYPALSAWLMWLCIAAWFGTPSASEPQRGWHQLFFGIAAGIAAWLGLFFSLAFLPVLVFVKGVCLAELLTHRRGDWFRLVMVQRWRVIAGAAVGFWGPIAFLWLSSGLNLLVVWWWNYHNHAGFYSQFHRTNAAWLAINPLELTFAVGWPVMGAALWVGVRWLREALERVSSRRVAAFLVGVGVWGLLWLSGKNSGEAARLWLLLMPGVVWLAAHFPQSEQSGTGAEFGSPLWRRWALLSLALVACVATVHRVGGFHMQ